MGFYINAEPGVNIYVEDLGPKEADTVLLIHGWPLSLDAYEYQLDHLPKFGIRCVAMDTRGFGRSDKPFEGYGLSRLADDIRAVIDALGLTGITLGGHSMGGAIALRYMARHDAHGVSKLALFAAAAPSFTRRPDFPHGFTQAEVSALIEQSHADRPVLLRTFGEMFFYQYVSQPLQGWFMDLGLSAAGWATAAALVTLRDSTLFGDVASIRVPTLIMHGVHDRVCPFAFGQAQHQAIRGSVLIPMEQSGHGLFWEQRTEFNSNLARFVQMH